MIVRCVFVYVMDYYRGRLDLSFATSSKGFGRSAPHARIFVSLENNWTHFVEPFRKTLAIFVMWIASAYHSL